MRTAAVLTTAVAALVLLAPPAAATTTSEEEPGLVVSLTFDDGFKSQLAAAEVLDEADLRATFYVNSGTIEFPAYMTLTQLQGLISQGHEIGGHTIDHEPLEGMDLDEIEHQVCDDRAALARIGIPVQNFAYPHGAQDDDVVRLVQGCGYNSARGVSGLYVGDNDCESCPPVEDLALADFRWAIRTGENVNAEMDQDALRAPVQRAIAAGEGWLPIVFHQICETDDDCPQYGITRADFEDFVGWLQDQPVEIKPVRDVVGGEFQPVVGQAPEQVGGLAPFVESPRQETLSSAVAWTVLGVGIGQQQLIIGVLVVALVAIALYRVVNRVNRYQGGGGL
jgi:peptidoglycan/xylan/chitin deacetylase (PgdA/CDA1 family)